VTYFNDTTFGNLFNNDFDSKTYINHLQGSDTSRGTSISWTGDIGGLESHQGDLGNTSSYFSRYLTRTEATININTSRGIANYFNFNNNNNNNDNNDNNSTNTRYHPREQYWSARYIGMITPNYPELYRFEINIDDDSSVRLYIGGIGIGLNNSNLGTLIVNASANQIGSKTFVGYYQFTDTKYREFLLEYQHYTSDAFLQIYWESLSTSYQSIPSTAFTHWRNISHYNFTIHPAPLCSRCSTVYDLSGLVHGQVAQMQSFLVYARDSFGNLLQVSRHHHHTTTTTATATVKMVAMGEEEINTPAFRGKVTDYHNSTYLVQYYPTQAGTFRMYVTITSTTTTIAAANVIGNIAMGMSQELQNLFPYQVQGSPFTVHIQPAILNATRTIATGKGIVGGVANETLVYIIHFKDIFNNPTYVYNVSKLVYSIYFEDAIVKTLAIPNQITIIPTKHNITVSYQFERSGKYWMYVNVGYHHENITLVALAPILASPFHLLISPIAAAYEKTTCRGLGLRQAILNQTTSFEIQLYDIFHNKLIVGGNKFYIRFHGDANQTHSNLATPPICTDTQNGRYICQYTPIYPGSHQLSIGLLIGNTSHPGGDGLVAQYYHYYDGAHNGYSQQSLIVDVDDTPTLTMAGTVGSISSSVGSPIFTQIEPTINLLSSTGFFLPDSSLTELNLNQTGIKTPLHMMIAGQAIQWSGYLVAPRTDRYSISMTLKNMNASIFLDHILIFDNIAGILNPVNLIQNAAYRIRVEAGTRIQSDWISLALSATLVWSTENMRLHPISQFFLYSRFAELPLSPFPVVVSDTDEV
jgi:hypothetical protein